MNVCLRPLIAVAFLLAGLTAAPFSARAAQSYDSCAGFIDSVPATITTQGVWCLRHDLATSMTFGDAIDIQANNVTIDCNDFKLGGLGAGDASTARGIVAQNHQNITVRHCNVRGFILGINLEGGAGHLVEDNRLDNNLYVGIYVTGYHNRVRRNAVYDTGGQTYIYGIAASADLVENTVSGIFADAQGSVVYGIVAYGDGVQVRDNQVSGYDITAVGGGAYGIVLNNAYQRASGNRVTGNSTSASVYGIYTNLTSDYCLDNAVGGFTTNISSRCISSGNLTAP